MWADKDSQAEGGDLRSRYRFAINVNKATEVGGLPRESAVRADL